LSDLILHVVARGMVQGVGYRAFVADEAARHGIDGWVRNRRDGTVEAVFAGPAAAVESIVASCRKGPWGARVDAIDRRNAGADRLDLRRPGETFSVLPTV
jgi:acylphosphatase